MYRHVWMHLTCCTSPCCAVAHTCECLVQAPPATVDERDLAFTEMASGLFSEDDDSDHDATAALEGTGGGAAAVKPRRCKAKKDAAKEERRKAQAKALAEKRALKAQRRDVDAARQLQRDIEEDSAQQELRRQRREVCGRVCHRLRCWRCQWRPWCRAGRGPSFRPHVQRIGMRRGHGSALAARMQCCSGTPTSTPQHSVCACRCLSTQQAAADAS